MSKLKEKCDTWRKSREQTQSVVALPTMVSKSKEALEPRRSSGEVVIEKTTTFDDRTRYDGWEQKDINEDLKEGGSQLFNIVRVTKVSNQERNYNTEKLRKSFHKYDRKVALKKLLEIRLSHE